MARRCTAFSLNTAAYFCSGACTHNFAVSLCSNIASNMCDKAVWLHSSKHSYDFICFLSASRHAIVRLVHFLAESSCGQHLMHIAEAHAWNEVEICRKFRGKACLIGGCFSLQKGIHLRCFLRAEINWLPLLTNPGRVALQGVCKSPGRSAEALYLALLGKLAQMQQGQVC